MYESPPGAPAFVLNYRAGRRERRYTIGSFPDWNASQAREEAEASGAASIRAKTRWANGMPIAPRRHEHMGHWHLSARRACGS